jgi:two-component system cell cycle sensor histidine kinase/response regulator CckA
MTILKPKTPAPIQLRAPLNPVPGQPFVLIVDDETTLLSLDERFLAPDNFEVVTAASGAEALALVEAAGRMPDLLITDFMMPDMNGRELADAMRARKPDLKVLYQTGFSDKLFGPRELLEPGTSFLDKPFTSRGLREAARLALFGVIDPIAPMA